MPAGSTTASELLSLLGIYHPWGFMLFAMGGGVLLVAGVVLYLWSVLPKTPTQEAAG